MDSTRCVYVASVYYVRESAVQKERLQAKGRKDVSSPHFLSIIQISLGVVMSQNRSLGHATSDERHKTCKRLVMLNLEN